MLTTEFKQDHRRIQNAVLRHTDIQHSDKDTTVLEVETRKRQEKLLIAELSTPVNINFETWAGHRDDETRRLDHDIFSTTIKRSYLECIRYIAAMKEVKEDDSELALLQELINSWVTFDNFEHIATLLRFSQEDVTTLITELESGTIKSETDVAEVPLDKSAPWYKTILAAIAVDDIVPLVMMRKLILERSKEITNEQPMATLRQLFVGLQKHIEREVLLIVNSDDDEVTIQQRLGRLTAERHQLYEIIRGMNRSRR